MSGPVSRLTLTDLQKINNDSIFLLPIDTVTEFRQDSQVKGFAYSIAFDNGNAGDL
jgi:hypothetical protein